MDFLRNLLLLAVIGIVLFMVAPDTMAQIFQLYQGLGILTVFILVLIIAALPRRRRRR